MKVVLLKAVQQLGHAGEVKNVNDGYARNYLIPSGLAIIANEENLQQVAKQVKKKAKAKKKKVKK